MELSVKELSQDEVDLITAYWVQSSPEHLRRMGADPDKVPPGETFREILSIQLSLPVRDRQSYALIWQVDGNPVGHCNVNQIQFGRKANMHLHLWQAPNRRKGIGTELVKLSVPHFFRALELDLLVCEPFAENPAPNKTLPKAGFEFVQTYRTVPGSINFEQKVNQWVFRRDQLSSL